MNQVDNYKLLLMELRIEVCKIDKFIKINLEPRLKESDKRPIVVNIWT